MKMTNLTCGNVSNSNISNSSSPDTFDNLYPALIRVFSVIILGYVTGRLGVISATEAKGISKFAIYPTLPAFIFRAIALIDFSKVKWMFVLVVTLSKCIVFFGVTMITFLFTRDIGKAGVYSVFCTMSNDLALGVPILKALYQDTHKHFIYCVYLLAVVNVILFLSAGLIMMEFGYHRSKNNTDSFGRIMLKTIKSVLQTPVVLASIFGVAANQIFNQTLPRGLDEPLETLSHAFGAAALFYLGLSVVGKIKAKLGMIVLVPLSLSFTKVVILPLIIHGLCKSVNVGGDGMEYDWSIFGFLYGTIPTAPPTVIYAGAFGIQEDLIAFGLVVSTIFSAPVMFSSSEMSTVNDMNSTDDKYRNLLSNTRNDISFVAIFLACWVILILCLSRRYKTPPHSYTICLVISQLLLCISFGLTKSDSFTNHYKGLEGLFMITSLFATHCWTALLAFALGKLRCSTSEVPFRNKWTMHIIGWGLPLFCGGIAAFVLFVIEDPKLGEQDYFHYLNEQKTYLGFWVTILLISISVCVGSLIRLYRCDKFCKCKMMPKHSRNPFGEETPLLSPGGRENCHRCDGKTNCVKGRESPPRLNPNTELSTDVEDLDAIYSLLKSKDQKPDNRSGLELDKYYVGEQHQSERHVIVILNHVLTMIVCVFFCLWIMVGDETKSGIFLEVQLLVAIILSAQVVVLFLCFGFERAIVIDPLKQRFRRYWYGVDEVPLPDIVNLPAEEYHICEQFVHYHKDRCVQALSDLSLERGYESSFDLSSSINSSSFCFLGSELVGWLVEVGLVADRITAVHYGNSLLRGRVIRHSEKRYYFRDSNLTYEFCLDWDAKGYKEVA